LFNQEGFSFDVKVLEIAYVAMWMHLALSNGTVKLAKMGHLMLCILAHNLLKKKGKEFWRSSSDPT
jgi:hypothetical protein